MKASVSLLFIVCFVTLQSSDCLAGNRAPYNIEHDWRTGGNHRTNGGFSFDCVGSLSVTAEQARSGAGRGPLIYTDEPTASKNRKFENWVTRLFQSSVSIETILSPYDYGEIVRLSLIRSLGHRLSAPLDSQEVLPSSDERIFEFLKYTIERDPKKEVKIEAAKVLVDFLDIYPNDEAIDVLIQAFETLPREQSSSSLVNYLSYVPDPTSAFAIQVFGLLHRGVRHYSQKRHTEALVMSLIRKATETLLRRQSLSQRSRAKLSDWALKQTQFEKMFREDFAKKNSLSSHEEMLAGEALILLSRLGSGAYLDIFELWAEELSLTKTPQKDDTPQKRVSNQRKTASPVQGIHSDYPALRHFQKIVWAAGFYPDLDTAANIVLRALSLTDLVRHIVKRMGENTRLKSYLHEAAILKIAEVLRDRRSEQSWISESWMHLSGDFSSAARRQRPAILNLAEIIDPEILATEPADMFMIEQLLSRHADFERLQDSFSALLQRALLFRIRDAR